MGNDPLWDRWDEVDAILERALELPEGDRRGFLEEACDGDSDLESLLERLVALSEGPDGETLAPGANLVRDALGTGPREDTESTDPLIGASLGPYRVTRVLGQGGMGTVYLGEREDGLFERRVAIKTLRLALDTPGVVERFELERQILASLTHPSVAQMTDGGVTEDGRPYLVMEYVDGKPIDRFADDEELDIEDRIWLILAVAEAVDFAHRHMVVHRDLKPSNILVTDDGSIKLLDFGVAKLLDPSGGGGAVEGALTRPEARFITPEYAAPEQIRAERVTTATDVHALGVLLFELLTGRRPFAAESDSPFDVHRAVLEDAAMAASKAVTTRTETIRGLSPDDVARLRGTTTPTLRRTLSGDLDAILSKALRKRPEDRYGSVEELRADLRRYLTGFPVRAREGLRAYRARKFVRRHWLPVGAAGAFAVVLVGFSVVLAEANQDARLQRDLAQTEAENAQIVVDFLADVLRGRDPTDAPSDTLSAAQLVEWGVERVDAELSGRPDLQAELLMVLANAKANLGALEEATELAERSVELRRNAPGASSEELVSDLLRTAQLHRSARSAYDGLRFAQEALQIRSARLSAVDPLVAPALEEYGRALWATEQVDSAAAVLERALAIRRQHPEDERALTTALLTLAPVRRAQERFDEAEKLYDQGIPRYRALAAPDMGDLAVHLNNLAYLRRVRGDFERAAPLYEEALAITTELYGAGHPNSLLISANLASVLHLAGRIDAAEDVLQMRIEAAEGQWPEGHWRVASTRLALGDFLLRTGALDRAEPVLRAAAEEYSTTLGPMHDWTSFAVARLAALDLLTGDGVAGRTHLDRLHSWVQTQKDGAGGVLGPDLRERVEIFLRLLEDIGSESERERFAALLSHEGG